MTNIFLQKLNRKSYALYRMMALPMTLNDLSHSKSPTFYFRVFLCISNGWSYSLRICA